MNYNMPKQQNKLEMACCIPMLQDGKNMVKKDVCSTFLNVVNKLHAIFREKSHPQCSNWHQRTSRHTNFLSMTSILAKTFKSCK